MQANKITLFWKNGLQKNAFVTFTDIVPNYNVSFVPKSFSNQNILYRIFQNITLAKRPFIDGNEFLLQNVWLKKR